MSSVLYYYSRARHARKLHRYLVVESSNAEALSQKYPGKIEATDSGSYFNGTSSEASEIVLRFGIKLREV